MPALAAIQLPIPALCETIKALVVKGDYAAEKAEQYYIAAGKHLEELKVRCPKEWIKLAEKEIGLRRRRAYEYIALATGKKTLTDMRAEKSASVKRVRALRSAQKAIDGCATALSKYDREDQIKIIRALMEKLHIGIRDFAESKVQFRR